MYVEIENGDRNLQLEDEREYSNEKQSLKPAKCSEPVFNKQSCERQRSVTQYGVQRECYDRSQLVLQLQDVFTSLVESRWRVTLLVFSFSFLATWFIFGVLWWVVAHEHGDLKNSLSYDPEREPCVTEMHDFISCFLFSLETQYSTGYGTRSPTTECPEAIFLLIVQSIFGVLIQSTMAGIVFAKLARPKARRQHILFSKKAVVCERDGRLCLMFRVGDMRQPHLTGAVVRAWLLRHRVSPEGEVLPRYQHNLQLTVDAAGPDALVLWPSTVLHSIAEDSPLYDLSATDLTTAQFEIVVVVSGTIEATGQTAEARGRYRPQDVVWGHRFRQMTSRHYHRFDLTHAVHTPLCSARELDSLGSV